MGPLETQVLYVCLKKFASETALWNLVICISYTEYGSPVVLLVNHVTTLFLVR